MCVFPAAMADIMLRGLGNGNLAASAALDLREPDYDFPTFHW